MSDGPRKRRRPAKACEQCRHRKVRCDLTIPCGPCSRSKTSMDCSYRDRTTTHHALPTDSLPDEHTLQHSPAESSPRRITGNLPTPTSNPDGSTNVDLHQTIRDIQGRLSTLEKRVTTTDTREDEATAQRSTQRELRALRDRVQAIETRLSSAPNSRNHVGTQRRETKSVSSDLGTSAITPRLRSSARKVKFMGPTHWCNKMDAFSIIQILSKKDPDPDSTTGALKKATVDTIKERRELRASIKAQRAARINDPFPVVNLRGTIPGREQCDELVACYMRTFEGVYRVLHGPGFWREYEAFWRRESTSSTTMSAFFVKLLLVLSIGTVFYTATTVSSKEETHQLTQKWIYAAQWYLSGPSASSTVNLDGLQIGCLLLIARKASGLGASPWLSAASVMRMAVGMGLHRDPAVYAASLSTFQAEMRRRMWATILELVLQEALDSATPALVPEFDTRAPMDVDDGDLERMDTGTVMASTTAGKSQTERSRMTDTSLQILLYSSVRLRIQILDVIHNSQHHSYQETLDLGAKLRTAVREVAAFFRPQTQNRDRPSNSSMLEYTHFHAGLLNIQLQRYILAIYAPFTTPAENRKDPRFYYARKMCLEAAERIALYADVLKLETPVETPSDLGRLFMSGKGSYKGPLSLDVLSVLGVEIITQLEEGDVDVDTARDGLVQRLEHIHTQLFHIVSGGTPSMKRYGLLAAILGEIRALKEGSRTGVGVQQDREGDVKRAVYEAVVRSFGECGEAYRRSAASAVDRQGVGVVADDAGLPLGLDVCDTTLSGLDMSMGMGMDVFDINMPGLFDFPGGDGDFMSFFG
ncbi:hypothetical protein BJY04DRAFT_219307 [Aspergillus karnatakaensis]|uniref:uncharacterized protein n=1 Tax=Aspergillus karnatakaensis TaxID=1810916 RepID=UPI003CCDCA49